MAEVTLASASVKQVWQKQYFQEYIRESGFKDYMSNTNNGNKSGIVLCRFDQLAKEAGKTINIPFIGRLKSAGVTGSSVLDGNEESLTNFNCPISIDWRRNGVRVPKSTSFQTEIDLWNAAKDGLRGWEAEKVRDDLIAQLLSVVGAPDSNGNSATITYDVATTGQKNAYAAANKDRLLFGNANSNYSATWATALGNVITSTGKASAAGASLAKRIAKLADPHIRPYKTETGREFYVAFHGSRSFRDIKADATMVSANTNARAREGAGMEKNPIFQDGDIIYDGVIHHEVPEIDAYASLVGLDAAGGSSADVRPVFVCGVGAAGIAWGQMPTMRTDMIKDYGFRPGVALEELLGVKKVCFNGVQNGVVTWLVAAAADS
jgi:N4-gp56 family major capsid protein